MGLLMFWGPADRISSPTEKKKMPKQLLESVHSDRFCRVQNLPTSSVELIWPITELYFRQTLSTDFMNRFYQEAEEADKVEVAPGVTVASLRRFRTALIGPTQGLPKRRRLCR